MLLLEVRPEAELDLLEAASWYDGEREGLGTEFLAELHAAFTRIEEGPLRFPGPDDAKYVLREPVRFVRSMSSWLKLL